MASFIACVAKLLTVCCILLLGSSLFLVCSLYTKYPALAIVNMDRNTDRV